jgi:hypothetical protein
MPGLMQKRSVQQAPMLHPGKIKSPSENEGLLQFL